MKRLYWIIMGIPSVLLICSCNSASTRQKAIQALQEKNDSYALALKIGEYAHEYPGDLNHLPEYARILFSLGYFSESIHLSECILLKSPRDNFTRLTLAMAYRHIFNFSKSEKLFLELLASPPFDPLVTAEYQRTIIQARLYREVRKCDSMVGLWGNNHEVILRRADLLLKMNEGKASMADYALFLDSAGYNRDASFNRFRAAILNNLPDEAEKEIKRTRENLLPQDPLADQLSNILNDTRSGYAKISESPRAPEGYMLVGKSLVFLKMEAESIPYLEKALSLSSRDVPVRMRLAYVYALSGRKEDARNLVRQLITEGNDVPEELLQLLR